MSPRVSRVSIEHHAAGRIGIGEAAPRLSWQIVDAPPGWAQHSAEIEIRRGSDENGVPTVHAIAGGAQILVDWPTGPLASRERITARVRVSGGQDWSDWSEPVSAEAGLLTPGDWRARLISPNVAEERGPLRRPGRVRRDFFLPDGPVRARLYLTGHGVVEAEINGTRVGDEELTPGWTSYRHRLRYAAFDVTELVVAGENAIGVWLGDGWWRGRLGYAGGRFDVYGSRIAVAAQLEVFYADGSSLTVASDEVWTGGPGPILSSDLYDGEVFDARLHDPAWSLPGFAEEWPSVRAEALEADRLVAPSGPPVRAVEELAPVSIESRGDGRWVLDFGQNHSGRLRLRVAGPEGTRIRLRHAEVLQGGEVYTDSLRTAQATDELILGAEPIEWEPRFTIHGYRYAEVSGWPGEIAEGAVVSRVLHSDLRRTGWFDSSHALVNRLHENVVWSLRSNFVDIPTDCPQRDERLGWTGDIQVFAPTATFLYDVTGFLSSWLEDVAAEQAELDWVPPFVPYLDLPPWTDLPADPFAVWSDVTVLTPDVLHVETGDAAILRRQYASALAFLAHVERRATPELVCEGSEQLGDWLDPTAPPDEPMKAMTDPALVATAYFARSSARMAAIAAAVGDDETRDRFAELAARVADAFGRRYIDADSRVAGDTQTGYALTTAFDLWPDAGARRRGAERLAELVRAGGGRIASGFAGTPVVADALSATGHLDEAYQLLECTDRPSWLYAVVNDATTVWERWDSLLPDGSVYPGNMTSFNHYALGSIADWLHRVVAGIAPAAPAWSRITFAPRPGGSFTRASASHLTPYGEASIDWRVDAGRLAVTVVVPVGAEGVVELPGGEAVAVGHGRHSFLGSVELDAVSW